MFIDLALWSAIKKGTYVSDFDLDGRVIVSRDQVVSGRALSGDVQIYDFVFVVLHFSYTSKTSLN